MQRVDLAAPHNTVKVLASQADGACENKPWENDWCDVTDDPSCALTEAGYLQVYYGGKDAQRLQMAARVRLPTSLVLRYHARSLINFVSLMPSCSGVHYDRTASVLVCLSGTREVWLAPPKVKEAGDLQSVVGLPHFLDYDPRGDSEPHMSWKRVELEEGQGVWLPAGWWHVVYGYAGSVGMSLDVTSVQ